MSAPSRDDINVVSDRTNFGVETRPSLRINPSWYLNAPFFHGRRVGPLVETAGQPAGRFGHRISGNGHDGIFAEWWWDGEQLVLRNDRLGMYPIFYFGTENEIVVSTSIFKILAEGVSPRIDWPALAVFLRTGSFLAEDTPFEGIRALPPDATVTWRPGCLRVTGQYWFPKSRNPPRVSAVDDYINAFREAIRRRPPEGDFAVPLSGGRDSRHTLFALCEAGHTPKFCVTGRRFPPARTEDEIVAARVCGSVGVPHVIVGPPRSEPASYVAANVKTNMSSPRRGWKLSVVKHLLDSVATSYDGIGGDMLSGGSALSDRKIALLERGRLEELCRELFSDGDETLRAMIPRKQFEKMSGDVAVQRILTELERHRSAANPMTSFYFWNRTRRFDSTNPYGMFSDLQTVYAPFLDHGLFEHLASLPPEFNLGGWLHDEVIAKAYPRHTHIPYEAERSSLSRSAARERRTTKELLALLLSERPAYLLRPTFFSSRLLVRSAAFGLGFTGSWWIANLVYLTQLDSVVTKGLPSVAVAP